MSSVPLDVQCFDVERGLAKALGVKVETFLCSRDEYRLRIGLRWNLILTADQLSELWDDCDNPTALKDTFAELKGECLVFQEFKR